MVTALRAHASWRVLDGFSRSVRAAQRYAAPRTVSDLREVLASARDEGLSVALRGAGRSYGDAALNAEGLVVDLSGMNHMLAWDPVCGVVDAEPGLTIEGLWRRTLADGYWPPVVPGTMRPTLGGCVAMNIHGKNNFKAGSIGEHVLEFDLMTAHGEIVTCSREKNADVFFAAIGGLGLLGAMTRIRLKMKRIESGYLRVRKVLARDLDHAMMAFEESVEHADYVVGWIDCAATGRSTGRGVLHVGNYIPRAEDPDPDHSLDAELQSLPSTLLGVPKSILWRFMRPFMTSRGVRLVNAIKYFAARLSSDAPYLQSHVAFAFLLDYVPNWRLAYGDAGFVQHQIFLPKETAREAIRDVLARSNACGLPSYLGVLKRHREDPFLLTHALDGWSLAMDFPIPRAKELRAKHDAMLREITARVLDAGGRFYFAKDSVLSVEDAARAYGEARITRFFSMKSRLDPEGVFATDLERRVFGPRARELP